MFVLRSPGALLALAAAGALGLSACADAGGTHERTAESDDALKARAPDSSGVGPYAVTYAEYKFPAAVDDAILPGRATELWARVYWPASLPSGRPLLVFLHGNHSTCGRGTNPRVDDNAQYTTQGTCPAGYVVTPNHLGYTYVAERLASWGYVVVSINANRGITSGAGVTGDSGLNLARGRLILSHIAKLAAWNRGAEATPAELGVSLAGKLDLGQVGMMGHSRGGEGVRAAYNLYRDEGSTWPAIIGTPLTFRGVFEIGPVDGQTSRTLDALGAAWNVLLPMCDGDVADLQGMRPFDRMMAASDEPTALPKSMFAVWGTNHNFYNTEWQVSDAMTTNCKGTGHKALFSATAIGSAPQRETAIYAMTAFFRAHVGSEANLQFAQTLDPKYDLPTNLVPITPLERIYADAVSDGFAKKLESFAGGAVGMSGTPHDVDGVTASYSALSEHDPSLSAALLTWNAGGTPSMQIHVDEVDTTSFETLSFRISPRSTVTTAFAPPQVVLVDAKGAASPPVSTVERTDFKGYGGHLVLDSVRVPLGDFTGVDKKRITAVKLIFDPTVSGSMALADVRLSRSAVAVRRGAVDVGHVNDAVAWETHTRVIQTGNRVVDLRRFADTVEIEVESDASFPVADELPILRIGAAESRLGRYGESGTLDRLTFVMPVTELAKAKPDEPIVVSYGTSENARRWVIGKLGDARVKLRHLPAGILQPSH